MTKIIKSKYFISGLIIGVSLLSLGAYATTTQPGMIGSLFKKVGVNYKLMGDEIEDHTIDNSEIENNATYEVGRLGIGISAPTAQLHIKGDGRIRLDGASNTDYWEINAFDDGTDLEFLRNGNKRLLLRENSAMKITTGYGNIQIGPQNTSYSHFTTDRPKYFFNKQIVVDEGIVSSYNEDLKLQTSGTTRMTIKSSDGNVGIGTTGPTTKLDIRGKTKIVQSGTRDVRIEGLDDDGSSRNLAVLGDRGNDILIINYNNEYNGGTQIRSNLDMYNKKINRVSCIGNCP